MNDLSADSRRVMREDEQGFQRTGCAVNHSCYWDGTNTVGTLTARNAGGGQRMPDKENFQAVIQPAPPPRKYIVRKLTPLECCRLQGFPDWWTEDVEGSDSAQYKMWGNAIALPCAYDVLRRITKAYETERNDEAER